MVSGYEISRIIAEKGGHVIGVHHERANATMAVNGCFLRINMETRNFEHIEEIKKALLDAGFHICE